MAVQAQKYADNFDNNGCFGYNEYSNFNLQQRQNQQIFHQLQNLQQKTQSHVFPNSFLIGGGSSGGGASVGNYGSGSGCGGGGGECSSGLYESLVGYLEKEKEEVEIFISLQNESLKFALQQQWRHHLGAILRTLEEKTMVLIRQKDEEIAKAKKRGFELEQFMRRVEDENKKWQTVAAEKEALIVSLNNTIEQLKQKNTNNNNNSNDNENEIDDAESCYEANYVNGD